MLKGKSLLHYTKFATLYIFSPNKYEKNYKKILKCFQQLKSYFCEQIFKKIWIRKFCCSKCKKYKELKKPKI